MGSSVPRVSKGGLGARQTKSLAPLCQEGDHESLEEDGREQLGEALPYEATLLSARACLHWGFHCRSLELGLEGFPDSISFGKFYDRWFE